MNLFILSRSKKRIAKYMMDKHISKIILEAVQMLCTAKHVLDINTNDKTNVNANNIRLYKITHKNHPVSIWCRESLGNYMWVIELIEEMHKEWRKRYKHNKIHKSYLVSLYLKEFPPIFTKTEMTPFVLAMPEIYKCDDPIESYRKYYISKKIIATWKNREKPYWFIS